MKERKILDTIVVMDEMELKQIDALRKELGLNVSAQQVIKKQMKEAVNV